MSTRTADLKSIKLKIASPEEILSWSHGEVTKPETINYRTQRAEKDGLFCEKIFGPEKDWECYCGKYRRIRYKGIVCDKCGVEVTRSSVRRERMGHIKLATPVSHIWFLRGVPSRIGLIIDKPMQQVERVIYFASYIITKVDEEARGRTLQEIDREFKAKIKNTPNAKAQKELKASRDKAISDLKSIDELKIISEAEYRDLSLKYGEIFEAGIGAECLRKILESVNLEELGKQLEEELENSSPVAKRKILQRIRLVRAFLKSKSRPEWMFLNILPVMPPELRPMVQLDGGRYASADLNDLYRRVINRNNRLKYLLEINAPEVIVRNEKRMLQEAVDALLDNSARKSQTVTATTGGKRLLKSVADILKGKQGRFRQNLLGKRVDYSGRSVIIVGPELKLHQCGLPKKMALELFRPFVIQKLISQELAYNVRSANKLIDELTDDVWKALEGVIEQKYVLLNRAPTLHRLGIQAFQPVLIEGEAIQVHPSVCVAFNADFDGDQMAVHVPLSEEAQEEAGRIMLSANNLLKPATGDPIVTPTQDIILGCFFLTLLKEGVRGEGKIFSDMDEALLSYSLDDVDLQAKIKIRLPKNKLLNQTQVIDSSHAIETSVGRIIFNNALPEDFPYINEEMTKKRMAKITAEIIEKYGVEKAGNLLDKMKTLGFEYATISSITWGINDLRVPKEKAKIIKDAEKEVETILEHYQKGLLSWQERRAKIIETWQKVKNQIAILVPKGLDPDGSVYTVASSGARGSWDQPVQMAGMKGLVVNPAGQIIELPVISSFKEGFNVLEYFISTHGARKGTSDTALRTASAGYLTRRLVDVSQDVIIREEDCRDKNGIVVFRKYAEECNQNFYDKIFGRVLLEDVKDKSGKIIAKEGDLISGKTAKDIDASGVSSVKIRSPLSCKVNWGLCQKCYGYDLGHNRLVNIGEAVGIVAAQAIGEPGTQLTMRTFHTGGVAGEGLDITQGLPRVEEIFEARPPRGKALISDVSGEIIDIKDSEKQRMIRIKFFEDEKRDQKKKSKSKAKEEIREFKIPLGHALLIKKGDTIEKGDALTEGSLDLKELFKFGGEEKLRKYVIREVQQIYTGQGVTINDRHIEIMVRKMLSRVRIKDVGDGPWTHGEIVELDKFNETNGYLKANKKDPATAQKLLLGISKISLTTESYLSAASFQETSRVLIKAAIEGREDKLRGLKENVIVGRLIPAGTGYRR